MPKTITVLEVEDPHFTITLYKDLLKIDLKGSFKNDLEEALENKPVLKETIGNVLGIFVPLHIRLSEIDAVDLDEIDWVEQSIRLKPHPKRSNCVVFFDDETARVLQRWIRSRQNYQIQNGCKALFLNEHGERLERHGVLDAVTKHAQRVGLHNPSSKRMEDHFTPHCCRHWFTTHLRRNGMRRELIQELRGDSRSEAVDIYDHIDKKELKRAYLAAIPVLGIE